MEKEIEQAILDAVSNVSCETKEVSKDVLVKIKEQLLGNGKKSDDSFIYSLYQDVVKEREKDQDGYPRIKGHGNGK